ncbi:MAG: type II toxin-antitoxin system HigB family toxin [Deltaproteobacteria bacterium]|nr:type II toxin-antitoxin system HigB family toxin [Deltaproteobacteria bacterium]MBW1940800.1 type II toxin-antitoxin system HigB family toxin [Deltaproteobacteria bacterium]MBW2011462.1 type II toxin-antitoxin system HigB family toxin [Deltaproteobacteria bacterium]MBW2100278.1 type II toxin-antitoxin system HigB family toxin [Deltaproteobacteria bacterium]
MHIISRKKIREFCEKHPESRQSMDRWYTIVKKTEFGKFQDVKNLFPSADKVKNLVVFDIGGNNYRLIAFILYKSQKLYIRHILTHTEYDAEKWKDDEWYTDTKK